MSDPDLPAAGTHSRPRVVVVDDSTQTRSTFQVAFPGLELVGEYATVDELLAAAPVVDVVVLDLLLSQSLDEQLLQGPRAIRMLSSKGYRVCVYTDERRLLVLAQCFSAGARGLVRKSAPLGESQAAFRRVAADQEVVPPTMVELAELLRRRSRLPELTARQVEVLAARARGVAWEALARNLGISSATAKDHLKAVMSRMVWVLQDAGLDPNASPADIEHALGLTPGDLNDPRQP